MIASQSQALEMILSKHAMCKQITGFGSSAIPACNAVKTLHIKESADAQKDEKGEGRIFPGSLAQSYW